MSKWLFSTFLMFHCPFTQFWSYLTLPFSKFKRWCWYVHRRFHLLRLCPTRFANLIFDKNVIWQQNCVDAHYIPFHMGSSWNVVKKKGQEANFYSLNSNMLPRIACLQCLTLYTIWVLIIKTKLCYCWTLTLWDAKISPIRKFFEKKKCLIQNSNLWPQKLWNIRSTSLPLDQEDKT